MARRCSMPFCACIVFAVCFGYYFDAVVVAVLLSVEGSPMRFNAFSLGVYCAARPSIQVCS